MAEMKTVTKHDVNSSEFKASTWKKLQPSWKITEDLWGSALDIRGLEGEYLPKFKKEPDEKYRHRLNNSVFSSDFRHAIETMAGMVFRTDPRPTGIGDEIDKLLTDIDMCGNSFWSFNLDNFQLFLRDGNGFILVDAPPLKKEVQAKVDAGEKPTLRDRQDDRPYLVYYKASQVINYRHERVGSRDVLVQLTIEETMTVPDGAFGEKTVVQHRILTPGAFKVLQQDDTKKFSIVQDEGTTGMDEIKIVPVIRDMAAAPPLLTLALFNILHYNQTSDYDSICHLVCTPREVRKFDSKEDAEAATKIQTASPGVGMKIWGEHAEVSYVEVSGSGMQLARERYQDVKKEMAAISVSMLAPTDIIGMRTATEVADTAGQRQSKLAKLAREWENAMEKALYFLAEYVNAIRGSKIIDLDDAEEMTKMRLKIDYNRLTFSLDQLHFFSDLVDSGKLSLQTFLEWLPQVADMPQGFDPGEEMRRITSMNTITVDTEPGPEPEPKTEE
jgi:hypothetical protein